MIKLVKTRDERDELIRWSDKRTTDPVAIDTETIGLYPPHQNRIRLIQFGDEQDAYVLPWDEFTASGVLSNLMDNLRSFLFHNAGFDIPQICYNLNWGMSDWPWDLTEDTMLIHKSQNPLAFAKLETLAEKYIHPGAGAGQEALKEVFRKNGWDWETVPIDCPEYWQYAGVDVITLARLYEYMRKKGWVNSWHYNNIERPMLRVGVTMSRRGVQIDPAYCEDQVDQLSSEASSIKRRLKDTWGLEAPSSNEEVSRKILSLGGELPARTSTGKIRVTERDLLAADQTPESLVVARLVLDYKKRAKQTATYYENFLSLRDDDNRVHPQFNTCQAATTRTSMSNPNFQNVPKRDLRPRSAIVPKPGHVLVSCDWDQLQMRIMAHLSGDHKLIRAASDPNRDMFCELASKMYGTEIGKGDYRRSLAKNGGYAIIFGAGYSKLAQTAGISIKEAVDVKDRFLGTFDKVKKWSKEVTDDARDQAERGLDPESTTLLGRPLFVDPRKPYSMVCYKIQGHEAELAKQTLIAVSNDVDIGQFLTLFVHDEVILEVPEDLAEEAAARLQGMMTRDDYKLPITAGADIINGPWGSVEK